MWSSVWDTTQQQDGIETVEMEIETNLTNVMWHTSSFLWKTNHESVSVSDIKNYTRYLYFEHRCDGAKPKTVDMCLFYQKEGGECL